MSSASTLVPLEGALNFRDIGGYSTANGRIVRTGMAYRADNLASLTDDDLEALADLGVRTVYDLRRDVEVQRQPSRLWPSVASAVRLPIGNELTEQADFLEQLVSGQVTEVTVDEVAEMYVEIVERHATTFVELLSGIADLENVPAVFHCTAGKDRTGVAAALLHGLLGVATEDIVADFALSNVYRVPRRLEQLRPTLEEAGVDIDRIFPALSAPPAAMEHTLEHLEREHGGVVGFLTGHGALDSATIEVLRDNFLISAQ